MTPRHRAIAAALGGLAALWPRAAPAAELGCPGLSVEPDAAFRSRWPDLPESIQNELTARTDVDACARVGLRLGADTVITVSVWLPDGRAASRSVTRREDVIPSLQALLIVPDHAVPAAAKRAPAAPRRKALVEATSGTDRDTSPPAAAARQLGIELSVISGVRVGDGQVGYGVGALSFFELKGWLLGFEGRVDGYRAITGGDPETALELAILAGKRLDLGDVALDLTAGPAVAIKGFALSEAEVRAVDTTAPPMTMPPPPRSDTSSGPAPRLLLGARLGFNPRSIFRTFIGIDGEIGPARGATNAEPSSARLPAYSVGLALGATVGTP